jgi:hypothetical protein
MLTPNASSLLCCFNKYLFLNSINEMSPLKTRVGNGEKFPRKLPRVLILRRLVHGTETQLSNAKAG